MDAVADALMALIAAIEATNKGMTEEVRDALSVIHTTYCAPEPEDGPDESMDGDAESALASAGMGVDEDYGCCDFDREDYLGEDN